MQSKVTMKLNCKDIGNLGEERAVSYLRAKGYYILARQFSINCKKGEIDIIALFEGKYIFVEVKYRTYAYDISAFDLITKRKQKNLVFMALHYCQKEQINLDSYIIRFDVIYIVNEEINHIENAFVP